MPFNDHPVASESGSMHIVTKEFRALLPMFLRLNPHFSGHKDACDCFFDAIG